MSENKPGRAAGGKARALSMSPEARKASSAKAVAAKAALKLLPKATHGSLDHPLKIGDLEIPCYVLEDFLHHYPDWINCRS